MKYVAWVLVTIFLLMVGGGVYLYLNANVAVEGVTFASVPAIEREAAFGDHQKRLLNGAAIGTIFSSDALFGTAADYAFYTYTVKLENNCFVPAEMIQVQILPTKGDVLQELDETMLTLAPKETGAVSATILTRADNHAVRQMVVTYYLWGYVFTVTKSYG